MLARITLAASALALAACQSMTTKPAPAAPAPTQAAAPAAPPPAWQQGRTAEQASSTLAPVPGRMTATAATDIPMANFKLPPGFKAGIWATGLVGRRSMVRVETGKTYMGTRAIGRVYETTDNGSTRSSRVVVDKLTQPAGVALRNGSLYVIAIDKVLRFDGIESNPAAQPV